MLALFSGAGYADGFCVGSVRVQLDDSTSDLFAIATNPFAGSQYSAAPSYPLSVSIQTTDLPDALAAVDAARNPFLINLTANGGQIIGVDRAAVMYAVDTIAAVAGTDGCGLSVGEQLDWAGLETRALHFVLRRVTLETAKAMIDRARRGRFNTVIMGLADAVDIRADIVPLRRDALTRQEFVELVEYARANGLEVIPGLPLLTHQQGFFKKRFPELMYNESTYDPRKAGVYELVFEYFDTLIDLIEPENVVIGHDEVKGMTPASARKWLKPGEKPLPPELFLQDLETLGDYFAGKGVKPWIWGDMLIARAEFPNMHKKNFHGAPGFTELRQQLPSNIGIIDWHYHNETPDFPTVDAFTDAGHDVLGASWKNMNNIRLFAEYMAKTGDKGLGMVAGTFWHVQKQEWEMVDQIVSESGLRFWQAGKN